jgi:hypothetical protein
VRFAEVDILGVYVAPVSAMMLAAWVITLLLRRLAVRWSLLQHIWHPALFMFSLYIIVLSMIVLVVGAL